MSYSNYFQTETNRNRDTAQGGAYRFGQARDATTVRAGACVPRNVYRNAITKIAP